MILSRPLFVFVPLRDCIYEIWIYVFIRWVKWGERCDWLVCEYVHASTFPSLTIVIRAVIHEICWLPHMMFCSPSAGRTAGLADVPLCASSCLSPPPAHTARPLIGGNQQEESSDREICQARPDQPTPQTYSCDTVYLHAPKNTAPASL